MSPSSVATPPSWLLALWGLPEETLHAGMKQVYIVDARISAARIKAVPANNRTVVHTNTLEKLELFLPNRTVNLNP